MRILLTNSSDIYGGGEYFVLELALELARRGTEVFVAARPKSLLVQKCRDAGLSVLPLDFPPQGKLFRYVLALKRFLREQRIDLIHTNSNYDRTAGAFAARLAGIPHVTNVHSFHSLRHNITHWVRNSFATDHYLVDGYCVKELLVSKDAIPADRISVVYLGVDPDIMRNDPMSRAKVRAEFGFSDHDIVVGNVGRLVPFKGQEFLLKAFAAMRGENVVRERLLLVGDGELMDRLRGLATEMNLESRVTFAGFRDDLPAIYSAFDLYVHPSVEGGGETFPFAVLQALSQELPVIVTKVGDVAAMVEEGLNGFVVPDRNVGALTEKLNVLLADGSKRVSMGRESRLLLLRRFTLTRMGDAIQSVYGGVINRRS